MATTTSGFWYPDGTEPYNIKALLSTAAASQESTLQVTKLRGGKINYATTGARDSAYTAAGGAVLGDQCSVAGQPQWYDGTTWQTNWFAPAYGGLTRSTNVTVTQGTTTLFDFTSLGTSMNMTQGLTVGATIVLDGRYNVVGYWLYSGAITGTVPALSGQFTKNGTGFGGQVIVSRSSSGTTSFVHNTVVDLVAGDIIRMGANPQGGSVGATTIVNTAFMYLNRIA